MGKFLLMGTFLLMAPGSGPGPWSRAGRGPDLGARLQVPGPGPGAMSKNVPKSKNLPMKKLAHKQELAGGGGGIY